MQRTRCRGDSYEHIHHVVRQVLVENHMPHSMVKVNPVEGEAAGAIFADVWIATPDGDIHINLRLTAFDSDATFTRRVAEQLEPYCTPRFTPV